MAHGASTGSATARICCAGSPPTCTGADPDTRQRARALHGRYLQDRSSIPPDLVDPVVSVVAADGTDADFATFVDRFHHPADPQEEVRYLYALARFEDRGVLQRALDL